MDNVGFARIGDLEVAYHIRGKGRPLLLLGGIIENMDWWHEEFLSALAKRFRLVLLDNRGAGRTTERHHGFFTIRRMARDTVGLMDHLGLDEAHVLGVSMGGMVAQQVAIDYPDRVDRLVLTVTSSGALHSRPPRLPVFPKIFDMLGRRAFEVEGTLKTLFPADYVRGHPETIKALEQRYYIAPSSDRDALRQVAAAVLFNSYMKLPRIEAHTLVVRAEKDAIFPGNNSTILFNRIPNSELVDVEGAGHEVYIQCPALGARIVTAFLASSGCPGDKRSHSTGARSGSDSAAESKS